MSNPATHAGEPALIDLKDTQSAIDRGLELLAQRRYALARDVFRTLERTRPSDARVWYLAAVAQGLSTGDWDGETHDLLVRGLERERAGTPSETQIEQTLSRLGEGQDWLNAQRRRVASR